MLIVVVDYERGVGVGARERRTVMRRRRAGCA